MGLSQCSDCGLDFQSLLKAAALCVCQFEMSGDKADKAIAVYVHSKQQNMLCIRLVRDGMADGILLLRSSKHRIKHVTSVDFFFHSVYFYFVAYRQGKIQCT